MVVPAGPKAAAAEPEMMEMKTMMEIRKMMKRKTLSSFLMTESRSLSEAAMAFFSR